MDDQQRLAATTSAPTFGTAPPLTSADVCRTVMVIDGSYAYIGAQKLPGGRIDFVRFRDELERQAACRFRECWFFDHEPVRHKSPHQEQSVQYTQLKLAPPRGPQFQLKLYAMKKYACYCRRCGNDFTQNVQKGVDNGIATKILSLAYENVCDRFILFAGDGDFYDSLNQIKNVLRKDLWVIGYRDSMSADLQQLATHVIWLDDLWPAVQASQSSQQQQSQQQLQQQQHAGAPSLPRSSVVTTNTPSEAVERLQIDQRRPIGETGDGSSGSRRVRLERNPDPSSGNRPRAKMKNRRRSDHGNRRNQSRSRSRSRSPQRQSPSEKTCEGNDQPLYFVDTGQPKRRREDMDTSSLAQSSNQSRSSRPARREPGSARRGKRKRQMPDAPLLTFELSDMSSEEDEQHPLIHRAKLDSQSGQNGGITIIDLASDSE